MFKHPKTGIQYPRNWLTLATAQEKKDVGFIEVTYSGSHKDGKYYIIIQKVLQFMMQVKGQLQLQKVQLQKILQI